MENLNGQYDIVITGGRVMDPETTLDTQRNVGVKDAGIEMPYPQLEVHFDKGVQIGNINKCSSSGG